MRILALATFLGLSACTTAQAQPPTPNAQDLISWESPLGRITYTQEDGPFGILDYPVAFGDNVGRFFIDGLAGEYGGVGPLTGYWSEPDVSHDDEDDNTLICPFYITDGLDRHTRNWGRMIITFLTDDFPSDFVILKARCFEDPKDAVPGKLVH